MQRLTKQQIINETVVHYLLNLRSVSGTACKYINDDGNKCAFSRCCTNDGAAILHENFEGKSVTSQAIDDAGGPDRFLRDEYKGHSNSFWRNLQELHDDSSNFIIGGYSPKGIEKIKTLMERYK